MFVTVCELSVSMMKMPRFTGSNYGDFFSACMKPPMNMKRRQLLRGTFSSMWSGMLQERY